MRFAITAAFAPVPVPACVGQAAGLRERRQGCRTAGRHGDSRSHGPAVELSVDVDRGESPRALGGYAHLSQPSTQPSFFVVLYVLLTNRSTVKLGRRARRRAGVVAERDLDRLAVTGERARLDVRRRRSGEVALTWVTSPVLGAPAALAATRALIAA
jgi:hypothetical protein